MLILKYFTYVSLQKCVDKDPARRWSCEQLLRHPYFDNFHFKIPESELEEFEKLRRLRDRSRVSRWEGTVRVNQQVNQKILAYIYFENLTPRFFSFTILALYNRHKFEQMPETYIVWKTQTSLNILMLTAIPFLNIKQEWKGVF